MYIYKLLIYNLMGPYIYIEFSKKIIILLFYRFMSNFESTQVETSEIY